MAGARFQTGVGHRPSRLDNEMDVRLLLFEQLTKEIDIAAPVIEEPQPWDLTPDPPLRILIREIAEKLHPAQGVTGWLYTQEQLARYAAEREREETESSDRSQD